MGGTTVIDTWVVLVLEIVIDEGAGAGCIL
jgi:hypothetical protein